MSGIVIVVLVFFVLAAGLGGTAYFVYQRKLRRAKSIERALKMVPLLIHLPPPSNDTVAGGRDVREVMREKTAQAEVLYNLIAGTARDGFKSSFYGQRHIALELVASGGIVHFYIAVPINMVSVIEQAVISAYPGARLEEAEDHNIFSQNGRLSATVGGELVLKADPAYPIATYATLERDPLEGLLTTLSGLTKTDGAAVQIMIRPARPAWVTAATKLTGKLRKGRHNGVAFGVADLAKAAIKAPTAPTATPATPGAPSVSLSQLELTAIEQIEEKTKHPGFEVLIRVIVSAENNGRSQQVLQGLATSFALFERPGLNGFKFLPALDVQGLVTAFIFRFFPPEMHGSILNSSELATIFHLPDSQFTPTTNVVRQTSKEVDGPVTSATTGLLFGYNEFRGVKKEIRLSVEDRRRHTYILGQTGTGKSTLIENLIVQDMLSGNGFAFIDPHGESAEKLLSMVPKSRAEDVIYFNPADMEFPLGLNLFEFSDPMQKDFLIQESLNMLYKLYDPNGTGVIGPRFEQWYRNAALTLMADPNGATFIEIPKVFTDTEYLKDKFKYLKDPTVIDFWTKEMGQTSDYHKSEMLGYFVSKFGAFQQNEMMRNIIGQTKSAFNMRDIMDNKKILIVNLSKGQVGELNSKLLGMMFVIKFQAAAMSRANTPEAERADFSLYVDEFQNFSTDSFASILSEARKYRLNLIVANQFMGQLTEPIRDAVFGNIGTIVAHRMGPDDAEFMVKQLAPVFDASDLMNLPNYHSAVRLMVGGLPSQPFTMSNLAALGNVNLELGAAIKQLSAAKYGLARPIVESDIAARLTGRPVAMPLAPQPLIAPSAPPAPMAPAPVAEMAPATVAEPAMAVSVATPSDSAISETRTTSDPGVAPIGAPPVDLTEVPMNQPALIIAPEPVDDVVEPERVALGQPILPAVNAAMDTAPLVVLPPIGAPPVNLDSLPEPLLALQGNQVIPLSGADKNTLSIRDITGGMNRTNPEEVTLIPLGAEPSQISHEVVSPKVKPTDVPSYDPTQDPMANVTLLAVPAPTTNSRTTSEQVPILSREDSIIAEVPIEATYDPADDPMASVPLTAADVMSDAFSVAPPVSTEQLTESTPPVDNIVEDSDDITWQIDNRSVIKESLVNQVIETEVAAGHAQTNAAEVDDLQIHFVDPSLEAVLSRPVETNNEETVVAAAVADIPRKPAENLSALSAIIEAPPIGSAPVDLPEANNALARPVGETPTPASDPLSLLPAPAIENVPPSPAVSGSQAIEVAALATPQVPATEATLPQGVDLLNESNKIVEDLPKVIEKVTVAPLSEVPVSKPDSNSQRAASAESIPDIAPVTSNSPVESPAAVAATDIASETAHSIPEMEAAVSAAAVSEQVTPLIVKPSSLDMSALPPLPLAVKKPSDAPAPDPAAVVAKTEATINDLLSTSLIRSDASRHRMAEIASEADAASAATLTGDAQAPSGRHWVGSGPSVADQSEEGEVSVTSAGGSHYSSTHKVIEPLGPILPAREELVQALVAEAAAEMKSPAVTAAAPSIVPEKPMVVAQPISPPPSRPSAATVPTQLTEQPIEAVPEQVAPAPVALPEKQVVLNIEISDELPQAESLAASDVAAARDAKAATEAALVPKTTVQNKKAEHPLIQTHRSHPASHHVAQAKVEADPPNKLTPRSEANTAALTGKLILPTAQVDSNRPMVAAVAPVKPAKLAKGEIFVDGSGNVTIGE
jgi:hypothetical protein